MKNRVLVSVGWPAQQMGCWSTTTDWEAKNTSCMVQRQVKNHYREPSTEEKKSLLMCFFCRAAGPLFTPIRSGIWYHFFPEGEQVSARPRFCILTCVAHDIRRQWFQLIFWGPYRPMGFFLKISSPMYFLIKHRSLFYLSIYKNLLSCWLWMLAMNMNVSCEPEFDTNVYLFCCTCVWTC